jgi:hypothetical protein
MVFFSISRGRIVEVGTVATSGTHKIVTLAGRHNHAMIIREECATLLKKEMNVA